MIRNIFISAIVCVSLYFMSCSDDNTSTPSKSVLDGIWSGGIENEMDTTNFKCTITEKNGVITGTGELSVYYKFIVGSTTQTFEHTYKNDVTGTLADSNVIIKMQGLDFNTFEGRMTNDVYIISGKIKALVTVNAKDTIIEQNIKLSKAVH